MNTRDTAGPAEFQADRARAEILADPTLTNTERRMIEENPNVDPYDLLATVEEMETT